MSELRIVFMGTPDFSVSVLKVLIKEKYPIVGVITAPDKPAGRGRKLNESPVKKYALENNLKLLQPSNLKDPVFLNHLKALKANLQIVVAFRMLPKLVWDLPELGTFNLHASLLPDYRGAAPINWAIINGETKTGVTTFFLDDKIDTGEIILQKETSIGKEETVGELHDKLMHLGSKLVVKTIQLIQKGKIRAYPQPKKSTKVAYKIDKQTCKIDWDEPIENIYNKIRGLNPHPAAWTNMINDGKVIPVKLFDIEKEIASHKEIAGKIHADKKTIKISVNGGYLHIKSMQFPGKKKMQVENVLNGYRYKSGAKML